MRRCNRKSQQRRGYARSATPPMLACTRQSTLVVRAWQVGWEEEVEAAMTHLLRSVLARNSKEAAALVAPRKHMGLVLERLAKGMRLVGPAEGAAVAAAAADGGGAG